MFKKNKTVCKNDETRNKQEVKEIPVFEIGDKGIIVMKIPYMIDRRRIEEIEKELSEKLECKVAVLQRDMEIVGIKKDGQRIRKAILQWKQVAENKSGIYKISHGNRWRAM